MRPMLFSDVGLETSLKYFYSAVGNSLLYDVDGYSTVTQTGRLPLW